ncbi:unnamed protein product [Kluyveromyces dobzhanskii CBS 2104]|uniref:WGS project CCBQ000000000 data, contig 00015 n=1 Tax=Kluyveromyces dobzhanskii CBS 2104 TaxID=1427455 RepID=A0A0A8L907_9SACH|nr:unnamed protein product [Kluyveromyces dobzhanskii CBS 2104]
MNVLVYNGAGTSPESVKHTIETLRLLLEPYYAVSPVSARVLETEPWTSKTSVVVFPGGADLPYVRDCKKVIPKIKDFVSRDGGVYIGLCAGAYFGSARCEFAQGNPSYEVTGPRDLKMFPGIARGPAFSGFEYNKELGAKTVRLRVNGIEGLEEAYSYYNGGSLFVDAAKYPDVEVLAEYQDPVDVPYSDDPNSTSPAAAAVVLSTVGKGKALLIGTHPEIPAKALKPIGEKWYDEKVIQLLEQHDTSRFLFMKEVLRKAGLKCNSTRSNPGNPDLTPIFVTTKENNKALQLFKENLRSTSSNHNRSDYKFHLIGDSDEFDVYEGFSYADEASSKLQDVHPAEAVKQIIFPGIEDTLPKKPLVSHFDTEKYFAHLNPANDLGSVLLYGDVVTSTSMIFDQNRSLSAALPENSAIHVGTIQLLGRGRGGNTWVNPRGVLASTTAINLPAVSATTGERTPIVFVQYLAMLAYCKAIRTYAPGYEDLPVKIKWPNDLYALKPQYYYNNGIKLLGKEFVNGLIPLDDVDPAFVKVSGLLVTTNFVSGKYSLLLGCGVNVTNEAPTTSLATWVNILNTERDSLGMPHLPPIEHETLLAKYLNELGILLKKFLTSGPSRILPEYYSFWMHSDQIVQLLDHNSVRAKLVGITEDYGLLIAKELIPGSNSHFTGNVYHLQPDGNTFDIFKGLISKKA